MFARACSASTALLLYHPSSRVTALLKVAAMLLHAACPWLQMFGERLVIANAVGCSSVWGGWEPSNPYTVSSVVG